MTKSNIEKCHEMAVNNINKQLQSFTEMHESYKDEGWADFHAFVNRVMEWRMSDDWRATSLYQFLGEVVDMDEVCFLGSFRSFAVNALLDDSDFCIRYDSNNLPVVDWGYDSGSQEVSLLMEAMDAIEAHQKSREEKIVQYRKLMQVLSGRIRQEI